MDKLSLYANKEMSTFCFSDDQDWRKFSLLPVYSCYAAFHGWSAPICIKGYLRPFFHWGVSRAQFDTLSWFNVVFVYCDHGSRPHTVTLSLFQIPVKLFKFFRFKSKPKTILQNISQMRKSNLVLIQISAIVICPSPCGDWRRNYATYNIEFVAAIEERTWSNV